MSDPTAPRATPLGYRAAFVRLSLLVASVALLTSRVMLLVHEFVGHAAPATLFGGRVVGWYLFVFAGGRVSYRLPALGTGQRLVVTLGGIALEVVFGVAAFALARRLRARAREREVVAFCLHATGTVLIGHGAIYLARGVHYGFGDGAFLAQLLGGTRIVVVALASVLAVGVAAAGGRRLARFAADFFAGSLRRVASAVLLVFACAGAVHGALAFTEVRYASDAVWGRVMEPASVVAARDEVARRLAEAKRRGEDAPSPEEQARLTKELERARRPWPLDPFLVPATVAALIAGVLRGVRDQRARAATADAPPAPDLPTWASIRALVAALSLAVALILVLRSLAP